ncbi:MAG: chemotaxis-specific protein-glutamate methyltransferase CheB [Bacteroidales bacterium]|nr:chemotaxis-specific protein-glutamate methyltransferase CheB [Bacteroidales bacterium]
MNNTNENRIRVLVVDDSLVSRKLHQKIISGDPRFEVVGTASNGEEAFSKVRQLKPDVVSMDVNMPQLNGIEATRNIMKTHPLPIVIVSSLYNEDEKQLAVEAAAAGAVYIMPKPRGIGHPDFDRDAKKYIRMLKNMSEVKVVGRRTNTSSGNSASGSRPAKESINDTKRDIILIGASAGGPQALKSILEFLPPHFPLPVLIVQHLDKSFTESFRAWIAGFSKLPVTIAKNNEEIKSGHIYIAPGGENMTIKTKGSILLTEDPAEKGHKPSVAALFSSAGHVYKKKAVAILLSGMGRDGAAEMQEIKKAGAFTIAQEKQSCLVFGMPGEAVKLGAASAVLTPEEITNELLKLI